MAVGEPFSHCLRGGQEEQPEGHVHGVQVHVPEHEGPGQLEPEHEHGGGVQPPPPPPVLEPPVLAPPVLEPPEDEELPRATTKFLSRLRLNELVDVYQLLETLDNEDAPNVREPDGTVERP